MVHALRIEGLTKTYGSRTVLAGVGMAVSPGEVFSLCGDSGAGKTTVLRIVAGLLPFDSGEIEIASTAVRAATPYPRSLYGRVGLVFQEHNLFPHLTVGGNVSLALLRARGRSKADARVRTVSELERVGLADRVDSRPAELSAGERQRVAIARALALDPHLLLLDEPTSNLHPRAVRAMEEIVRLLAERGSAVLVVSHNVDFATAVGDRFGLLSGGRLETDDDPAILVRSRVDG